VLSEPSLLGILLDSLGHNIGLSGHQLLEGLDVPGNVLKDRFTWLLFQLLK
jgi:hypothetical protein